MFCWNICCGFQSDYMILQTKIDILEKHILNLNTKMDKIIEKTQNRDILVHTPANTPVNTPVNIPVNTPVNIPVNNESKEVSETVKEEQEIQLYGDNDTLYGKPVDYKMDEKVLELLNKQLNKLNSSNIK